MQLTRSVVALTATCTIAALVSSPTAHGKTVYSVPFDYKKFPPSSSYFQGKSLEEIDRLCKTGDGASTDDAAACEQRNFERSNSRLNATYAKILSSIRASDKESAADDDPLAAPDFVGAQENWSRYRERYCYAYVYALGEASGRYIYFWNCMKDITQDRIKQLEKFSE
ncbi:DUF1311 domain-containing protein [Paraburkholderia sprentiae WSM5005]|uniref:DUF1311 domain-containing protein n=1 Tax=Paraburkholderia sprentiae WSM5005 TaxID=754502 RepID=A0A1I9YRK1_9BURK|nr:lysozyme inhibitor LprI family protein [Paraburkholderia sprentiae]APA88827.1 DUF1311 domain-containing protein [Paraburkholderia sprentiae WSM5005]